ncbi:unnamed protein product [Echinostoma caproni]|uniref:AAA domain-containing protein n=1 Tax=Echinostoma caproni TaxID=27848 RepID=A0A183B6J6_9TREM|nr:unnamed protein product [Echinostoma caproni]
MIKGILCSIFAYRNVLVLAPRRGSSFTSFRFIFLFRILTRPHYHTVPKSLCETKLSSSNTRFDLLGTLLRPVNQHGWSQRGPQSPYVIGLAGPSGAGKSALARRLAGLSPSVHVIDCDRLGHEAYLPGTKCHQALLDHFSRDAIASPDPRLGRLVFSDPKRLKELNAIVWPEIESRVRELLCEIESNSRVVVLDAAVLLQAKWDLIPSHLDCRYHSFAVRVLCAPTVELFKSQLDKALEHLKFQHP